MPDFSTYTFTKLDHTMHMGGGVMMLDVAHAGVYFRLRLQAGYTRQHHGKNDGSLAINAVCPAKKAHVLQFIQTMQGMTKSKAATCFANLKAAGVIDETRYNVVRIAHWKTEQEVRTAPASKKQARRETNRMGEFLSLLPSVEPVDMSAADLCSRVAFLCDMRRATLQRLIDAAITAGYISESADGKRVRVNLKALADEGHTPPRVAAAPSPPSTFDVEGSRLGHVPDKSGHVQEIEERREDIDKDFDTSSGGEGAAATRGSPLVDRDQVDIHTLDPVTASMSLCQCNGARNQNSFRKALHNLQKEYGMVVGGQQYTQCLAELQGDIREGKPIRNRAAVLTMKLNSRIGSNLGPAAAEKG